MGVSKSDQGIGALFKKYDQDVKSWEKIITRARHFGVKAERVYELIGEEFDRTFYQGYSIVTFVLAAVYQERLEKLKKGEKPYAAQSWILRHYPGLVDMDTVKLSLQQRKRPKYKIEDTRKALRSKRNIIVNKYKRMRNHPNFLRFYTVFFRSSYIQKTVKKFYIR